MTHSSKGTTLERHLLDECNAMAKYTLDAGKSVSANLLQELHDLELLFGSQNHSTATDHDQQKISSTPTPKVKDIAISKKLALIHNSLSKTVAPARPDALLLLASEAQRGGLKLYLGPIPLIRHMMIVALISLSGFILVSLSGEIDGSSTSYSLVGNSGYSLFYNELFLLTAAAVGGSFFALFQANHYLKKGTYDKRYETSYWIRFILGIMAGMIMATLVPIEISNSTLGSIQGLEKPLLAMLGGFSASVVYKVLTRLLAAVESLVSGDISEQLTAHEQEWKVKTQEQGLEQRAQVAAKIQQLQKQFQGSDNTEDLLAGLNKLQNELFASDSYSNNETKQSIDEVKS
jgi:hypothetical protein